MMLWRSVSGHCGVMACQAITGQGQLLQHRQPAKLGWESPGQGMTGQVQGIQHRQPAQIGGLLYMHSSIAVSIVNLLKVPCCSTEWIVSSSASSTDKVLKLLFHALVATHWYLSRDSTWTRAFG